MEKALAAPGTGADTSQGWTLGAPGRTLGAAPGRTLGAARRQCAHVRAGALRCARVQRAGAIMHARAGT
eukprot:14419638-Alexandrium_andersonii.AAC.1